MTDATRTRGGDRDGGSDSDRGRRLYDRWADRHRLYRTVERDTRRYRERGIDELGLSPGDRVLDVGCGPGTNLELLSRAVGPTGEVVAYDYSEGMVDRARRRAAAAGLENVTVERADVTEPLPDRGRPFDAATATLVFSATADPRAAVRTVHGALRPGGRLLVVDGELHDGRLGALFNPVLARLFRALSNWTPEAAGAIRPALAETFERTVREERIPPGLGYWTVVEKAGREA